MNEQIRADCFKRGELFGEIALFYSCKRTATVKSEDSVVLWGRTGGLTNTHSLTTTTSAFNISVQFIVALVNLVRF